VVAPVKGKLGRELKGTGEKRRNWGGEEQAGRRCAVL